MTLGRRVALWDHTAAVLSALTQGEVSNPWREAPAEAPKSPEDEERESAEGWRLFDAAMTSLAK